VYQEHVLQFELARLALAEGQHAEAHNLALAALAYFAGEGYQIETPGARVLALVACTLAGDTAAASQQADSLLELLPKRDLARLLAVAAREQKTQLTALLATPALAQAALGLLRMVEQFEASMSGWRRSVRRQAEVVPFAPPRLHIRALGKIQVKAGERALSGADWQVQSARDLLFLLLVHPEGLTKEQIGELFWPDSSLNELKLRFKNTIYRLRHAAGKEVIVFEGDIFYRFNRALDYEYDVENFLKEIALAQKESNRVRAAAYYRSAIKHFRGPYLPGVDLEWALVERERLQQIQMDAVLALGQILLESRDYDGALNLSQQALTTDPCQEEAHRLAMRVYAAQGNRAMIIRQYGLCCQSLMDDVGADPSTQTRVLYESLIA
jgi:DNA-binding SARP family transcriptional activator